MKNINLKTLFAFVTGVCIGLVIGIAVSNQWDVNIQFGRHNTPTVNGTSRLKYLVQVVRQDGETTSFHNHLAPSLPPVGSEFDPNYQAEVVDNGNGTMTLLPAPAYRKGLVQ